VSKALGFLVFWGTAALCLVLYFVSDKDLSDVLAFGAGGLLLLWLIVVLTVPWSLYFQARALQAEIRESVERGLEVPEGRAEEAARYASRLLRAAIGAHVVSAAVIAVIAFFSGREVGYWFAGFYLVSTLFRPSQAYFAHLRTRLRAMMQEVKFPREDVLDLKRRLDAAEAQDTALRERIQELTAEGEALRDRLVAAEERSAEQAARLDRRLDALGRRFQDTVAELTDNQEVISGIKAFLRLLRTQEN
jgi:hypothetical protein